jgi:SAM-dependent methyltransferase
MLAYLAARTDIVAASGNGYAVGSGYDDQARFVIDLYARAFAPVAADIAATLRRPGSAAAKVDRRAQSDAFTDDDGGGPLTAILRQLEFNHFLDVGCGNASLLRALAVANPDFAGIGIDANPAMCRVGRRRARAAGVARRVVQGDGRYPERVIDAHECVREDALSAWCKSAPGLVVTQKSKVTASP